MIALQTSQWSGHVRLARWWGISFIGLAAVLLGCSDPQGPERIPIQGLVSLDGKELSSGVIRFIPRGSTQGPAASSTIQNGKYELSAEDGPIAGSHRVEIEATNYMGFAIDDEAAFAASMHTQGGRLPKNPVPDLYNRQSTLGVEISASGQRQFDFELKSTAMPGSKR